MTNSDHPRGIAVRAAGLRKSFGGIQALKGADLEVKAGTIHALVGENGAGKSTALGAIAGRLVVDSGEIEIFGADASKTGPRESRALGVAAIYQELTVLPAMTACENVFLGQSLQNAGFLAKREMRARFEELCERAGVRIPANARAGSLSVADQQMVEILRGLESGSQLLLLDEPTASLVQAERDSLFRLMRELRDLGVTMVIVSHNLDEVLDISDEITVFRNGATVATGPASEWTKPKLVNAMLGQAAPDLLANHRAEYPRNERLLSVRDLSIPSVLHDVTFEVKKGEILGIAGLVGSGRTTLLRSLAGSEPNATGMMEIDGREVGWPKSVTRALQLGIALVPEDRKGQGLFLHMSSRQNIGIANLRRFSSGGLIRQSAMRDESVALIERFAGDASRVDQPVRNLSGGNQQKVLLARWQLKNPLVLLADEPTRGIDVGAKASILSSLRSFAEAGAAVVVVSSELEELTTLADRVLVLSHGRIVEELHPDTQGVGVDRMLSAAFGS